MPPSSPPDEPSIRPPHPLATLLAERLRARTASTRVLDFATGRGRNAAALRLAGLDVETIDDGTAAAADPFRDVRGNFDGAISTHGLLHGSAAQIATIVEALAGRLKSGAFLVATFGSTRDRRFGEGARIDSSTFAASEGDERGVAHAFFTREQIEAMLAPRYEIESLDERAVDEIAGKWAHEQRPLEKAVHWFVVARRRGV